MKFGKFFRRNIEAIVAAGQQGAVSPPFLPYKEMKQFLRTKTGAGGQGRQDFVRMLDQSVKEIEEYYVSKYLTLQERSSELRRALQAAERAQEAPEAVADAFLPQYHSLLDTAKHLVQDINTLKMYASLHAVAVGKIAKKFDKCQSAAAASAAQTKAQAAAAQGSPASPSSLMPLATRYELKLRDMCFVEHEAFQKLMSLAGKLLRRIEENVDEAEELQGTSQVGKSGSEEHEETVGQHRIRLPRRRQRYGDPCHCACISARQMLVLTFSLAACLAAVLYISIRFFFARTLLYSGLLLMPLLIGAVVSAWMKAVDDASRAAELNSQTFSPLTTTQLLLLIPTNIASRVWGIMHSVPLPRVLRKPSYLIYSYIFGCILEEVRYPLDTFKSLGEFFRRPLKDDARFVELPTEEEQQRNAFVFNSPVDGKIVAMGEVVIDEETGAAKIEQIKGLDYSLNDFLGVSREELLHTLRRDPGVRRKLFQCVIYLAPGDYHRIHSPISWNIVRRMHFPGCLLPVNPLVVKFVRGLFAMNERVVLEGEFCRHGQGQSGSHRGTPTSPTSPRGSSFSTAATERTRSEPGSEEASHDGSGEQGEPQSPALAAEDALFSRFYFVAVGALNVGGIELSFDKEVRTNNNWKPRVRSLPQPSLRSKVLSMNRRRAYKKLLDAAEPYGEGSSYHKDYSSFGGISVEVGEEVAHFKLGSTVVLIWEMEEDAEGVTAFANVGDKVRVGQKIFTIQRHDTA